MDVINEQPFLTMLYIIFYSDDLFDNDIDFDDDDNFVEDHPFSDIPLSTLTPADIEGRVRSLHEIFQSLHVSSEGCQKMLVCHLAKVILNKI